MDDKASVSEGTPSPGLQGLLDDEAASSAFAEEIGGYHRATEAAAERGVFTLVDGFTDPHGVFHNEVQLRAMSGNEEDLLGNKSIPTAQRMDSVLSACIERFGSYTTRGDIAQIVHRLPSGVRTHLLVCLRIASHWQVTKDVFAMTAKCPFDDCKHEGQYNVSLLDLEKYPASEPGKTRYEIELPASKAKLEWRVLGGAMSTALDALMQESRAEALTWGILVRLVSWDGQDVALRLEDLVTENKQKAKLSARAKMLVQRVKALSSVDRDSLRATFLGSEAGIETDIQLDCEKCGEEFDAVLDVGQPGFFFPQATSTRLRRKSSS
jgi:hypothetical protein